jgi:micrococcal nuclease
VVAALVAAVVAVVAGAVHFGQSTRGLPKEGRVTEVVDGDTLRVAAGGATYTLRLIGVDTPEAHPSDKLTRDVRRTKQDEKVIVALGRRASEFTRRLCDGKPCRLEYDPANTAAGHRDKYDRVLAFVFVPGEGGQEVLVNAEIIRQGYGRAFTSYAFDDRRKEEFRRLEHDARAKKRGLWKEAREL